MAFSTQLPLFARAAVHPERTAIEAQDGSFTYGDLLSASEVVARALLEDRADLSEARVAFLVPPGFAHAAVQWGIWRAGGMAIPLPVMHPPRELDRVLEDAEPEVVVVHPDWVERVAEVAGARSVPLRTTDEVLGDGEARRSGSGSPAAAKATAKATARATARARVAVAESGAAAPLPSIDPERRAMMIYTSGTTGHSKGVVTTHSNTHAQVQALVEAWEWSADDRILLVLPLHHVHGIINVLTCALWSGAVCQMAPRFDAADAWGRIRRGGLTLFMAVPTIYARLIRHWEEAAEDERTALSEAAGQLRLWVSGSAALPVRVLERWKEISGHTLLERYGMTEIGMGLSNPLHGRRRPGHVGQPVPGIEARIVDDDGCPVAEGEAGQIHIRGRAVFHEYWRRPVETEEAFQDGWFCTGDQGVVEDGAWRILGRRSVDIIKCGGYKVSALEIEEVLRTHPDVDDCAVVAVADEEFGERIAAAVVRSREGAQQLVRLMDTGAGEAGHASSVGRGPDPLSAEALRAWARERLAPYKVPSRVRVLEALPRNAMGKVTKPDLRAIFEDESP